MLKTVSIKLIQETAALDAINQPITIKKEKLIDTAILHTVTQTEYFKGRQSGLSPEYFFTISIFDYSGEKILEYNGQKYAIYRTYFPNDNEIELYTELKGGVTNG